MMKPRQTKDWIRIQTFHCVTLPPEHMVQVTGVRACHRWNATDTSQLSGEAGIF